MNVINLTGEELPAEDRAMIDKEIEKLTKNLGFEPAGVFVVPGNGEPKVVSAADLGGILKDPDKKAGPGDEEDDDETDEEVARTRDRLHIALTGIAIMGMRKELVELLQLGLPEMSVYKQTILGKDSTRADLKKMVNVLYNQATALEAMIDIAVDLIRTNGDEDKIRRKGAYAPKKEG